MIKTASHNPFHYIGQKIVCWSVAALLLLAAFAIIAPELPINAGVASATSGANNNVANSPDPLAAVLCNIISVIQGGTGKALATIALIFLAVGLFVGKISWGMAIAVGIGIGGMFGAKAIVNAISSGTTSTSDFCANLT